MQIENVAGICLTTGRTSQQQRHRTIRRRMLRQIVVDAKAVTALTLLVALVHEILRHRNTRIRSKVLQRSGVGSRRRHHDRISHRAMILERFHDARHRRCLLTDRNIDADTVLPLLIDDRIDRDRRFARAAVADDQLALPASDRNQSIDRFQARLQRLMH